MKKKYVKFLMLLFLLMGVVITYSLFNPATNKFFPACPFYKFTGFFCPGCGSQRALHFILTGNINAAILSNILLVIFLPFLIIYYLVEAINFFKTKNTVKIGLINKPWFIYSIAGVIIIFWVVRNLSFNTAQVLAPH